MLTQEQIMSILFNILVVYAVICTVATTLFLFGLAKHLRRELGTKETVEKLKTSIKLVYVEKVDDICYMYDGLTHNFITQADTEEQMWTNAKLRFPDKEFIIRGDSGNATVVSVNVKGAQ